MTIDNKRCETRLSEKVTVFVEVIPKSMDDSSSAQIVISNTLDISANGILVQMDESVPIGSILRLYAELPESSKALHLIGEVKWVIEEQQGFNIGFELYDSEDTDIIGWKSVIAAMLDT